MLAEHITQQDYYLIPQIKLLSKYDRWRRVADILKVPKPAKNRLEWIIYYYESAEMNVSLTARHFGISRKTFHKWFKVFNEDNIYTLNLLADKSKAPHHVRQREISTMEKQRVITLRHQYMQYGKMKLQKKYENKYHETISSWKIQKVIEAKKLYPHPQKNVRIQRKRQRSQKKKRITELELNKLAWYKKRAGYIICL
ncbi:MAG: hypothetical protein V1765_01685, partial [bacterium]